MIQFILIGIFIVLFYYYAIKPMSYWKNRGVIQGNPVWLFGDKWKHFFRLENVAEMFQRAYNIGPDARFAGFYIYNNPILVIKDPLLIKQIAIKDFEHFADHVPFIPEAADPLWSKNLFAAKDKRWKELRSMLSPVFSSSKMKIMYTLMVECSENLIEHFLKQDKDVINMTMKDVASRFANDTFATVAFGVEVDSLRNPNNDFFTNGMEVTNFNSIQKNIKNIAFLTVPKLLKLLKINFFDEIARNFFLDLIKHSVKTRKEQKIVRPDLIHTLVGAMPESGVSDNENSKKKVLTAYEMTIEEITAHGLAFFFGGFDSVSSTISFMAYELATHPEIQDRLRTEIDESFDRCNGKITYDELNQMKYMDMVLSEILRKWPNFLVVDRICTKEYLIEPKNPGENAIVIKKGQQLILPIYPLHYDEKYFPSPERFDPERFSNENNIYPYTYHPFGFGPRYCIGSRFATMELKVFFAYLLHHFELIPTSKTQIPAKISSAYFNLQPEGGINLGLKRLNK